MYPFDKDNPFRKISIRLLAPILLKSGLSANKITIVNFLILGLSSIILFAFGYEYLGLLISGLMAMIDYTDGTIARLKNEVSPLGKYLDTSLDWLYLMFLIGAISYHHHIMIIGYICLIALCFGNWTEYNGLIKYNLPTIFHIIPLLIIGIIINRLDLSMILITITQTYRTGRMYLWSIFRN